MTTEINVKFKSRISKKNWSQEESVFSFAHSAICNSASIPLQSPNAGLFTGFINIHETCLNTTPYFLLYNTIQCTIDF